jgi:hypothetical protein
LEVHFLESALLVPFQKCTSCPISRSVLLVPFQEVHFSSHFTGSDTLLQVKSTKTRIELDPAAWRYYTKPFGLYIHGKCHRSYVLIHRMMKNTFVSSSCRDRHVCFHKEFESINEICSWVRAKIIHGWVPVEIVHVWGFFLSNRSRIGVARWHYKIISFSMYEQLGLVKSMNNEDK